MIKCPSCGAQSDENSEKCADCGHVFVSSDRPKPKKPFYKSPYIYIVPLVLCLHWVRDYTKENDKPLKSTSNDSVKNQKIDTFTEEFFGFKYYGGSGKHKEAFEAIKRAMRINPVDAEAIEAYKQAVRIAPDYAPAHYYLGRAYVDLNDRDSALEQCEILKSIDPEMANKLFNEIYRE